MKPFNFFTKLFLAAAFLFGTFSSAQNDITFETKLDMPGDWGKSPLETAAPQTFGQRTVPQYLLEQFYQAKMTGIDEEKIKAGKEIEKYLDPAVTAPEGTYEPTKIISEPGPPFSPDWYNNDVQVYTGGVAYSGGYRNLDLKLGEDGWLYLAINRRNVSGYNGYVTVYRSSNGGATWSTVINASNTSAYFGTITMLVEKRHSTNNDSVRIFVYYNRSNSTSFDNAALECLSARRNGSAAYVGVFASPSSGHKYEYPSACSDGMYWSTGTYMHIVAREITNSGTQVGLRHFLSQNWGGSYSNALLNTSYTDMYPSIAYSHKGASDSIYVAIERRLTSNEYEIRALTTPEIPFTGFYTYFITAATTGIKYEKPCITVQQSHYTLPRRVLITCTKNNIARYHSSINGGQTWAVDATLGGSTQLADYTWCNSDSLSAGNGYMMGCFVDQNGDSVTVRRGVIGNLGTYLYKRNSVMSTGLLSPVCAIYKNGSDKWSSFSYAGQGPNNVYFNQESFVTGISPINGNIPISFELKQNYPNPFNPATTIRFSIPITGFVSLKVYDVLGNEIAELINENLNPGNYETKWNAGSFASGIYFYKLATNEFVSVKKMILVK